MTVRRRSRGRALGLIASIVALVASAPRAGAQSAESSIIACERAWRLAYVNGDTESIYRCLADDFSGVTSDGKVYDRRATIAKATRVPPEYTVMHLDWIQVRVFGSTAVAQGISSWTRRAGARATGTARRGRWIWTDTWLRRGDRWALVATEDVAVPPAP